MRTASLSILLLVAAAATAGCSTVLFTRVKESRVRTPAVYEKSQPFFLFGTIGKPMTIVVDQICLGKDADQISTEYTGSDVLAGILTLGIYAPRTVKVWCQL